MKIKNSFFILNFSSRQTNERLVLSQRSNHVKCNSGVLFVFRAEMGPRVHETSKTVRYQQYNDRLQFDPSGFEHLHVCQCKYC